MSAKRKNPNPDLADTLEEKIPLLEAFHNAGSPTNFGEGKKIFLLAEELRQLILSHCHTMAQASSSWTSPSARMRKPYEISWNPTATKPLNLGQRVLPAARTAVLKLQKLKTEPSPKTAREAREILEQLQVHLAAVERANTHRAMRAIYNRLPEHFVKMAKTFYEKDEPKPRDHMKGIRPGQKYKKSDVGSVAGSAPTPSKPGPSRTRGQLQATPPSVPQRPATSPPAKASSSSASAPLTKSKRTKKAAPSKGEESASSGAAPRGQVSPTNVRSSARREDRKKEATTKQSTDQGQAQKTAGWEPLPVPEKYKIPKREKVPPAELEQAALLQTLLCFLDEHTPTRPGPSEPVPKKKRVETASQFPAPGGSKELQLKKRLESTTSQPRQAENQDLGEDPSQRDLCRSFQQTAAEPEEGQKEEDSTGASKDNLPSKSSPKRRNARSESSDLSEIKKTRLESWFQDSDFLEASSVPESPHHHSEAQEELDTLQEWVLWERSFTSLLGALPAVEPTHGPGDTGSPEIVCRDEKSERLSVEREEQLDQAQDGTSPGDFDEDQEAPGDGTYREDVGFVNQVDHEEVVETTYESEDTDSQEQGDQELEEPTVMEETEGPEETSLPEENVEENDRLPAARSDQQHNSDFDAFFGSNFEELCGLSELPEHGQEAETISSQPDEEVLDASPQVPVIEKLVQEQQPIRQLPTEPNSAEPSSHLQEPCQQRSGHLAAPGPSVPFQQQPQQLVQRTEAGPAQQAVAAPAPLATHGFSQEHVAQFGDPSYFPYHYFYDQEALKQALGLSLPPRQPILPPPHGETRPLYHLPAGRPTGYPGQWHASRQPVPPRNQLRQEPPVIPGASYQPPPSHHYQNGQALVASLPAFRQPTTPASAPGQPAQGYPQHGQFLGQWQQMPPAGQLPPPPSPMNQPVRGAAQQCQVQVQPGQLPRMNKGQAQNQQPPAPQNQGGQAPFPDDLDCIDPFDPDYILMKL